MSLMDRIGVDVGRKLRLEDAIEWAARNEVRHIDIQLDTGANAVTLFDDGARLATMTPGTRVLIEGPYGALTADARVRPRTITM